MQVTRAALAMLIVAFHAQNNTVPPPDSARGLVVLATLALLLVAAATICGVGRRARSASTKNCPSRATPSRTNAE